MLDIFKNKHIFKHIFYLSIIYILAHGFIIFLSGRWWDDWYFFMHNDFLRHLSKVAAIPSRLYVLSLVWKLPNGGYRILVFLLFYVGVLSLYGILLHMDFISDNARFWICALFTTIPVNDARVTLACYEYSLDYCLFLLAFFLTCEWKKKSGEKRWITRGIAVIILLISFCTESLLCFSGLIILYLYYYDMRDLVGENGFSFCKVCKYFPKLILLNIDYLMAPILFFCIKHTLFKPSGVFESYNSPTINAIAYAIKKLPKSVFTSIKCIFMNYSKQLNMLFAITFIIIFMIVVIKRRGGNSNESYKKTIFLFSLGIMVLIVGIFPYMVVKQIDIPLTGVGGRHSLLMGIGLAFCIYYGIGLIRLTKTIKEGCYIAVILLGALHFNDWYLNYQEDWYLQLQFQNKVAGNQHIIDNNTFLCCFKEEFPCEGTRFYTLNGNAYSIIGDDTRFFMCGIQDGYEILDFPEEFMHGYNMDNYDLSDRSIDGVILMDNVTIGNKELLKLKWDEIFSADKFEQKIKAMNKIKYIPINQETSSELFDAYNEGELDFYKVENIARSGE